VPNVLEVIPQPVPKYNKEYNISQVREDIQIF
jgi:hypothetical protein